MANVYAPAGASGWHGACPYTRQPHRSVNSAKREGREEGREEGHKAAKYEDAIKMKELGSTVDFIAKVTGLSVEEIEKL